MKEFDFTSPRQSDVIPTDDPDRYRQLLHLREILEGCWSADTCADYEKDLWTPELPPFGQCAVTAILVQELFDGKMVKDPDNDHYWNILLDGTVVDLTRSQLAIGVKVQAREERTREYMLKSERAVKAKTEERYLRLKGRVLKVLGKESLV